MSASTDIKKGDRVLLEGEVVHTPAGSGSYVARVNGTEVSFDLADVKGDVAIDEPRRVNVRATIDISNYRVTHLLEALDSWDETIRGLGYVIDRTISDDDKSVTFTCAFETDEGDDMHARDRAQETMQELEASGGVEWEYVEPRTAVL